MSILVGSLSSNAFAAALARTLATSETMAALVVDPDLGVADANPAAREILGGDLVAGAHLADLVHGSDLEGLREAISTGAPRSGPLLLRSAQAPQDPDRALLASTLHIDDSARFVLLGRCAALDLRREARILRAQRYEIVGQLASGIAHDLNNRLSSVTIFSDLMLGDAEPGSQDAEDLAEIKQAGLDSAVITRKLDLFAGGHAPGASATSLPEVVRGFEMLIRRFVGEKIELETELDDRCAAVSAPPIRIEEVIIALVSNARDAMPEGGVLTLRAIPGAPASDTVVLEVIDTGLEDLRAPLQQALEPFFSSKPTEQGSGLGLATVHGIVTTLGGSIEMGRGDRGGVAGTRVRITLPSLSQQNPDRSEGAAHATPAPTDGLKVALIEPNLMARQAIERGLSRSGAGVSAFADLSALTADPSRWEAVVADVPDLPGAGQALIEAIRAHQAGTPVVLLRRRASPCAVPPDTRGVLELAKPTDLDAIRAALADVSRQDPPPGAPVRR